MTLRLLLRLSLALQLAAGALLFWWLLPEGTAPIWIACAVAALPVAATALVLGFELAVGAVLDPRSPRAPLAQVLRVWLGETVVSVRAFGWRQPFGAGFAEPPLARDPQRSAVLLLHGYVCNRAVWRPLLASGRLDHCNVATLDLLPVFGDIDGYATQVAQAVDRLRAASDAPRVILVCHSMGGLAARCYLRRFGTRAVQRLITLATPHSGTVFGRMGHGINGRQMATGSDFLRQLAADTTGEVRQMTACIASADDNLIVPRSSPLLPGAVHQVIDGVGHLALIEDPRAWSLLVAQIALAGAALSAPGQTPKVD